MSDLSTRSCGTHYEELAAKYLIHQGMTLIQRNFRCRMGEIDLIFKQKDLKEEQIIFVEVRFRNNAFYGGGIQSVDFRKQRKLVKSAELFLKTWPIFSKLSCRFDVVGITIQDGEPVIQWIQNAFQAF